MAKEDFKQNRWMCLSDSVRHCRRVPSIPGIYCFIENNAYSKKQRVVYIGKSQDLSIRLKPWHKVEHIHSDMQHEFGTYLTCKIMPTVNFHKKELEYIKRLTPFFNIQHNPIITRKIIYSNGQTIYRHRNVG